MFYMALVAYFLLVLTNIPFSECTSLFAHIFIIGQLGCFQILATQNKADINICVQVLYGNMFSIHLGKY